MDQDDLAREGIYDGARLTTRAFDELIGICRGVIMDGRVSDEEIVRLDAWCQAYPLVYSTWPGDVLARRIAATLRDGFVDEEERAELKGILLQLTGQREDRLDAPTELPLTDPPPAIVVVDETFCLTGTFVYGTRRRCHQAIEQVGGRVKDRVAWDVDYLVIGHHITPAWIHSTHGRKIEAAVELQRQGAPIKVVSEAHWSRAMFSPGA